MHHAQDKYQCIWTRTAMKKWWHVEVTEVQDEKEELLNFFGLHCAIGGRNMLFLLSIQGGPPTSYKYGYNSTYRVITPVTQL